MKKVILRIIDTSFNLLGEIDDYESLQFIRRFYSVGEFELHININKNNTDCLVKDNLILLGNSFNKVGIIMYRENQPDSSGNDELIIKGVTLKGIMNRRLILPTIDGGGYDIETGTTETVIKKYVDNNVVNPTDIKRKIPQLVIAENKDRGIQNTWKYRYENLADKICEISQYTQLGWDVTLDVENNRWIFDVIEGRNLTVDQEDLPPVIFSTNFDNILSPHFIESSMNSANVGYAGGKGENENRIVEEIGDKEGIERIENFFDCSNTDNNTDLTTLGIQKLDELKETKTFEFQIDPDSTFTYEKDYDLGDFVTAQSKELNITMNAQIIEIKEIYETDKVNIEATFGSNIPNLITKIDNLKTKNTEVPTKISEFENDSNYDTAAGAQEKADAAENNAKAYADNSLQVERDYADKGDKATLSNANKYTDSETSKVQNNLNAHLSDNVKHIATNERSYWNSKAEGTHKHLKGDITDFPTSLPSSGGTADKATITHRLYRHENESEDFYFISPYWTGNLNGWRIGAYNTNGDEQVNIHRVSVDYADSAGNVPTKLSQLENDIGAGAGTTIITSNNEPSSHANGRVWVELL
ncbi:siphovirus ReqiPepy6 Gp37-like family protein [Clostridium felsineum]|uniref:siphovirus ReqiPepy6 Gp37-like family protein n=1 Tax=Clostridium felsineum TaxID=36839 RepID=UPI00214DC7D8|nr:siphovirus ReqiPepy6 Gp37-like family protein [Clostridium felsineum]MCR3760321.1 siphovirus ReqiPepy6 Gp37-like family protein [Clostridium felsineum]